VANPVRSNAVDPVVKPEVEHVVGDEADLYGDDMDLYNDDTADVEMANTEEPKVKQSVEIDNYWLLTYSKQGTLSVLESDIDLVIGWLQRVFHLLPI
jgi:hypothetical protein